MTRGERNIAWIESTCLVPEGKFVSQPIKLREWQRRIILNIYDSPTRRGVISFGRKNAKTTLAAILSLLHLVGPEAKPNSQLYSTALSRDQAAILFSLAAKIVRLSPELRSYIAIRDTAKQLVCPELGTSYRALSADASTAYGLSPVFVVHDELGQVRGPRSELYEAMETAAGAQEAPLSLIISTQAPGDDDLLSLLIDDAKGGADPKVKLFLYTADEDLDPFSDEAIRQANPAYGDFLNEEEVRAQAESARRMPSMEAGFRNLVLNQRVNADNPWMDMSAWKACADQNLSLEDFAGQECWIGEDLASKIDFAAKMRVFRVDETYFCFGSYFLPEDRIQSSDRYRLWWNQGLINATPGSVIDFDYIEEELRADSSRFQVVNVGYDPHQATQHATRMMNEGFPMVEIRHTVLGLSEPMKELEALVYSGKLRHNGDPVLSWMISNVVAHRDQKDNIYPRKARAENKIDGVIALIMAIKMATLNQGSYIEGDLRVV